MSNVVPFPAPAEPARTEPGNRPPRQSRSADPEPLWRESLGEVLRSERADRGERIADVASRAGIAPQYLSEIERGRKDPSSEVLSAVSGALELRLSEVAMRAARHLQSASVTCLAA